VRTSLHWIPHPLRCRNFGLDAAHQPKPVSYPNQATAVLQKLAMLYGNHPACLGWGLLNEPVRPRSCALPPACCSMNILWKFQMCSSPRAGRNSLVIPIAAWNLRP